MVRTRCETSHRFDFGSFRICKGNATLSLTVLCGKSAICWNTIPICRARISRSSSARSARISRSSTEISPAVGSIRRLRWRTRVDLPEPESPITQNTSPRLTENEQSAMPTTQPNSSSTCPLLRPRLLIASMASSARSPKIFQTPLMAITA